MRSTSDVIVVGAGPAGSTLAQELSAHGVSVLLVDKARFPRPKCCGGGVTVKAARLLDEEISGVAERTVTSAAFVMSGSKLFLGDHDKPIMYTVMREKFDTLLLQRAVKAGVEVAEGVAVTGLTANGEYVEIGTDKGTYRGRYVVGADGSQSVVARLFGNGKRDGFVGIEAEVSVADEDLSRWKSLVLTDLGWTSKGYGWVFPKGDHLSVGIGAVLGKARGLKSAHARFVDSLGLLTHRITSWSAGFIPMYVGRPRVVRDRVALIGDAAGLADPLTGEGIGNAVLSARLAAPAIVNALQHGESKLHSYQESVEREIAPEIAAARFLARVIFSMPRKMLEMAKLDARLWNAGCLLVRGETSYSAIKGRVGTLGGLYSALRGKTGNW